MEGKTCSTFHAKKSTGADASSSSRPARSPARPMAPCWRPMARPWCSCTAVGAKTPSPGIDFFPLTVNYQEKTFAAGKIPGGFFKREGRPTEKETLAQPPDRPADPAAVRRRLPQRDAGRLHRAEPRHGERPGHRRDDRRLGRADASPASRSSARSAPPASAMIDGEYVLNPTLESAGQRARPGRRRHRRRRADGRVGGQGAVRGGHARAPSCSATAASSRSSTPSSSWPSSAPRSRGRCPAAGREPLPSRQALDAVGATSCDAAYTRDA